MKHNSHNTFKKGYKQFKKIKKYRLYNVLALLVLVIACISVINIYLEKISLEPTAASSHISASELKPTPVSTQAPTRTPTPTPTPIPVPSPDRSAAYIYKNNLKLTPVNYDSPALLTPTEEMGQEYIDKIVFICDSPTYWMGPFGLVDSTQIWTGPEGTMTLAYQSTYEILDPYDKVERTIRKTVELHKPAYIIIALGINGISFMNEEYFTKEYTDLVTDIQEISPETTIILQSIYPITQAYRSLKVKSLY